MPQQGRSPSRTSLAEIAEYAENLDGPADPNLIEELLEDPIIEVEPFGEPENLNNDEEFHWIQDAIQNNQVEQVRNDFMFIAEDARFLLDLLDEVPELPVANEVNPDIHQDMEVLNRFEIVANDEAESASFNDWINECPKLPDRENPVNHPEMRHATDSPNILNNNYESIPYCSGQDSSLDTLEPLDLALRALGLPVMDEMKAEGSSSEIFSERLAPIDVSGQSNEAWGFRDYNFEKSQLIRLAQGAQAVNSSDIQTNSEEKVCTNEVSIGDEESKKVYNSGEKSSSSKNAWISEGSFEISEGCSKSEISEDCSKSNEKLEGCSKRDEELEGCRKSDETSVSSFKSDEKSVDSLENQEKYGVSSECHEKSEDTCKNVDKFKDLFEKRKKT